MWQPGRGQLQRQERMPSSGSAPRCISSPDPWAPSSSGNSLYLGLIKAVIQPSTLRGSSFRQVEPQSFDNVSRWMHREESGLGS